MSRRRPSLAALLLALPTALSAADGDLDSSFSTDGKYVSNWGVASGATAVAGLGDGSLLVGGWVQLASGSPRSLALLKLAPNGALDPEFASGGHFEREIAIGASSFAEVLDIYPLVDGRILLAAWASADFQRDTMLMVRLLENGSPDLTFGPNGVRVVDESPVDSGWLIFEASARAPDGGLLFVGTCIGCDAASTFVLRLDADGEIDRDFGYEGWALFDAESGIETHSIVVDVDSAGRSVVAGNVGGGGGVHELFVTRLTVSGGFDLSFGNGDGLAFVDFAAYAWPRDLAIDPMTGRLLIAAGSSLSALDSTGILALDTDGELITTFGFLGVASLTLEEGTRVESIALQSDGKIVAAGEIDHTGAASTGFYLARLLPTGQFDDTFDDNGVVRYEFDRLGDAEDAALAVALVGGKLVAAGYGEDVSGVPVPAMAMLRAQSALVFTDDFERGSTTAWLGN